LRVAGVDEVGVGPLAGPVVAAAVVLPKGCIIDGVRDSKKLTPRRREELAIEIRRLALGSEIGVADISEIDRLNIYHAALLAMRRAIEALSEPPDHVLCDARTIPGITCPQQAIIRGDTLSQSIAAASIIAKVHRDALMMEYDRIYPEYGFARHKGYPTAEHQQALARYGPCPLHRTSFASVSEFSGLASMEFYQLKADLAQPGPDHGIDSIKDSMNRLLPGMTSGESRRIRAFYHKTRSRSARQLKEGKRLFS
jgi:ribonuclease HII